MSYDYRYAKKWRIERERGLTRTKPAARTAAHIDALRKAGWSYRGIGDAAGVSVQTINLVHRGLQNGVANKTERRVLALRADSIFTRPNKDGFVPNIGARRRLQALMAIGYRHGDITPRLGSNSANLLHQVGDWISLEKHQAMVRVYDELWDKPGPSAKAVRSAQKLGYQPPLAWDDDTIDDPTALPANQELGKGEKHEANRTAFIEDVEFLASTGALLPRIAEVLGATQEAVEKRLIRYGRADVLSTIGRAPRRQHEQKAAS